MYPKNSQPTYHSIEQMNAAKQEVLSTLVTSVKTWSLETQRSINYRYRQLQTLVIYS